MKPRTFVCSLVAAGIVAISLNLCAADGAVSSEKVRIDQTFGTKIIPISLSGYTGEAAAVLRFDLEVAGFEITDGERAQYALSGKSDGTQVEGRLQDKLNKANLLAKAYTG